MIETSQYTKQFFQDLEDHSYQSAKVVVPLVAKLIRPTSVIDVGCGNGLWLKVWQEDLQFDNYLGVEGPYLDKEMIRIPPEKIIFRDLKLPLDLSQRFDLVMSLEVAEHLPATAADTFIQSLTTLGDIVLFSAALPGQEGTYHINEQYPEYWAAIFKKYDFVPVDGIRAQIWEHPEVEYWYQQNILLFVKASQLARYPQLQRYAENTQANYLTRIHPVLFGLKRERIRKTTTFFGFLNWKWYMFKRKYLKRHAK